MNIHFHPKTRVVDAARIAESYGYRLYSDNRGHIELRPVATNAHRVKLPRRKRQYFRVFGVLPGGEA